MIILGMLTGGGAGDLVKGVGDVIDNLHTSKEEKLEAEQKVKELVSNYEVQMEKQITDRWKSDMASDSWLSKNVRPLVLVFLVVATVLMIFIDAGTIEFNVEAKWTDLLQLVLITVIGAYFGGSAYTDLAKPIVPPTGLVITAITFLADNTPTVLTPEKLDSEGPSYINIQGTSGDIQVADNHANFNGAIARDVTDGTIAAGSNVTIASASNKIKTGQYVLLVAAGDTDTAGITIDSETPIPITRGPNKQGVKVTSYTAGATTLTLDTQITPSTQGLIFLDDFHGAGGLTAASQVFPKGVTIYGRWTTITPSAAGVICYFGK